MKEGYAQETPDSERLILNTAHEKALHVYQHKIDMLSFASPVGNYDRQMVEKDMNLVADLEARYEERMENDPALRDVHQVSDIFEAMIAEQIKQSNWFGGNAEMIASSQYDDFINHVDGIVHFKVPGSSDFLALSTDVTYSRSALESNIRHIKENIREGKMTRVKYFELPGKDFKGQLNNVPHVILGAESKTVLKMAEQWTDEEGIKYIGKHWMQAQLLDMAIMQCASFAEYAHGVGNTNAAEKYGYMAEKIQRVKNMKIKISGSLPEDRDGLFIKLKEVLGIE